MSIRQLPDAHARRWLITLLALAFGLRLIYALAQDPLDPYTNMGGDSAWYLANGYALVTGLQPETMVTDVASLGVPPVYPVLLGVAQALLPQSTAIVVIRVLQVIAATATAYFAYRLASRLARDDRAGLLALAVIAVSPAFVIETAQIGTETLFIFLVTAALYVYTEAMAAGAQAPGRTSRLALAGVLLGLATLTRAVLLLFPLGLALHLLLVDSWRSGLRRAAWLLAVYSLVVSTWTIYNLARWNRFIIGGEGFAAFIYIGATEWDGATEVDERLVEDSDLDLETASDSERQSAYIDAAASVIRRDPVHYVGRRVTELVGAYVQPYGTVFFPGESLRDVAAAWLREDRSLGGLATLIRSDAFWPKLAIYVFHYVGLVAGLVGMWRYRRERRVALPLIGYVLYTTLIHLVLLALPRYIFPTEVVWWVFAATILSRPLAAASAVKAAAPPSLIADSTGPES